MTLRLGKNSPCTPLGPAGVSEGAEQAAEEAARQGGGWTRPGQAEVAPAAARQDQGAGREAAGGAGAAQDVLHLQAGRRGGT